MREMMKRHTGMVLFGALLLVLSMSVSATAATLITSKQIKNNSVKSVDIKDGTLNLVDLSLTARAALRGNTGPAGQAGQAGQDGADGDSLVGSACTRSSDSGDIAGTVELEVGPDGTMTFRCATPDLDEDGSSVPDDCNDADPTVRPGADEIPDGKDNNCDGGLGTGFPAYSGPGGTDDIGACQAGTADETTESPFLGPITGEVVPVPEIPDNMVDDNCDGSTDEV